MDESCPECQAVWSVEEIDLECCFCCGWPNDDGCELDWDGDDDHG